MAFAVPFTIGEEVTHNKLRETFEVGNMGGMRRSKKNNALVLICDHTKGLYDDQWFGDVLHYTGEGKTGDQKLERQNKTLFEYMKTFFPVKKACLILPNACCRIAPEIRNEQESVI